MSYEAFLATKLALDAPSGFDVALRPSYLFPFQRDLVRWALRRGRAALFASTGLGKTRMQLEWASRVAKHTGGSVLILAPLSVAAQTEGEATSLGIRAEVAREQPFKRGPIVITNYERLHRFDPSKFAGVVLDESSCIKHYVSKTLDGAAHVLPPLSVRQHTLAVETSKVFATGQLFASDSASLMERKEARKSSLADRVAACAAVVKAQPDEPWVVWCDLNAEADALCEAIPDAVEVRGSDDIDAKEQTLRDFAEGRVRVLVTKSSIAGFGCNWQHCARQAFVGLTDSWESYYQAIRRSWRFGQRRSVEVHVFASELEGAVVKNIERKARDADAMSEALAKETSAIVRAEVDVRRLNTTGDHSQKTNFPSFITTKGALAMPVIAQEISPDFAAYHADTIELARDMPSESVDFSVFSPPFASLYTYSSSERDMGNCRDATDFFEHFGYLIKEQRRVMRPGRLLAIHCMLLPTSKERHGYIGLQDFRGDIIRAYQREGFIFHSEVTIWKDPVTAMQRTKALGLLWKTIKKDSSMSRQGIPDYVVVMRTPGENANPIAHTAEEFPVDQWQQWASPVWMDIDPSDTLQYTSAREDEDERHICPLQLGVIRRCLGLWSNPGDLVWSPFMGIGSEGVTALQMGRRFVGAELKASYYAQAVKNLRAAKGVQQELL